MAVRVEIGIDCAEPPELAPFWASALGYRVGDLDSKGIYLDLVPPDPGQPIVYLQRVAEPKTVKNRLHLDLWTPDAAETIEHLTALGAVAVGPPHEEPGGAWWQVMSDPAGNEFCICREQGEHPPS